VQVVNGLECTSYAIKQDVPYQIWLAVTSSGDRLPIWLVSIFHNKLRYYLINYLQCFTYYLSPKFIIDQLGLIEFVLLLILAIVIIKKLSRIKWLVILLLAIYPLVMIF